MSDAMPQTELVLALYMSEQLINGNQDFISRSQATNRCILPMGFMEQVELPSVFAVVCDLTRASKAHRSLGGSIPNKSGTGHHQQHGFDSPLRSHPLWHGF